MDTDTHTAGDDGGFEPGAAFEPTTAPEGEPTAPIEPVTFGVGAVKQALRAGTGALNDLAGDTVQADLQMSELEAGLIAPGVVKYLEARPRLAATVAAGGNEYLQAAFGMGVYGVRVSRERAKAIEQAGEQAGEQLDEQPAEPSDPQAPIIVAG